MFNVMILPRLQTKITCRQCQEKFVVDDPNVCAHCNNSLSLERGGSFTPFGEVGSEGGGIGMFNLVRSAC